MAMPTLTHINASKEVIICQSISRKAYFWRSKADLHLNADRESLQNITDLGFCAALQISQAPITDS